MAKRLNGGGGEDTGRADRTDAAELAAYEAAAVRAESRDSSGALTGCLVLGVAMFVPALLYFGLFAVILVDEVVVETNWFLGNLPDPAIESLRVMYAPLIWLIDQFAV